VRTIAPNSFQIAVDEDVPIETEEAVLKHLETSKNLAVLAGFGIRWTGSAQAGRMRGQSGFFDSPQDRQVG
jgi:hypothetical protein